MKKLFIVFFLMTAPIFANTSKCVITMGYKVKAKEPFIFKKDSGLYIDLYAKASNMIGCELQVIREPKKRIIAKVKRGMIDFYPGFSINKKRAKFIYYIKNGLSKASIAVTRKNTKKITTLADVKKRDLIILKEKGGADKFKKYNFKTLYISDLSIKKAFTLILQKRADLYIGDKSNVEYYFKKYKLNDFKLHTINTKEKVWYLGFGRHSKHTIELKNPLYDKNKKLSFENYPVVLDKSCVAFKFQEALNTLKDNGYTQKLYNKYFK